MKQFLFIILTVCAASLLFAKTKKSKHRYDMTEQDLVGELVSCLQSRNTPRYVQLFPESDSIAYWVLQVAPPTSKVYQDMNFQLANPVLGMHKDSLWDAQISHTFDSLIKRGESLGINWNAVLLARYELVKMPRTKDSVYEKLSPTRFTGYFFLRDMLTRKTYSLAVTDILHIGSKWYGGLLQSIYIGRTIDDYNRKQQLELSRMRRGLTGNFGEDSSFTAFDTSDERSNIRKEVVDRKLFVGTFDNEVKVELYIRYNRGACPGGICSWDATFKFGDNDEVLTTVSRGADGKWTFAEENGVMVLTQNGNAFTGTWTSASDQTEYEVSISETGVSNKKARRLDEMIDRNFGNGE